MKLIAASNNHFKGRSIAILLSVIGLFFCTTHSSLGQAFLYGTTENRGEFGAGAIFRTDKDGGNIERVFSFPVQNTGNAPEPGLLFHSNGFYYGVARFGGTFEQGVLFRYDRANGSTELLHTFTSGRPAGQLIEASNGNIYGTSSTAGTFGGVFEYDPVQNSLVITSFSSSLEGLAPEGKLLEASNGLLYGTTRLGSNSGTIFSYDIATRTLSNLATMSTTIGKKPFGGLIQAADGKLYGTTSEGGTNNSGTIFSYDITNDTYTDVILFNATNGARPLGDLIQLSSGLMYGTTRLGGTAGNGTIFKFDPSNGTLTSVVSLNSTLGAEPHSTFIQASNGLLYATTKSQGTNGFGTLLAFDPVTELATALHHFTTDGGNPVGELIEVPTGTLLGTTSAGGSADDGTIFEYNIGTTNYTKEIDFGLAQNGESAFSPLLPHNEYFYGTTAYGGAFDNGTLFQFDPRDNAVVVLHEFESSTGNLPIGELMIASDGKIYGVTNQGGTSGKGTIYSYDLVNDVFTAVVNFGAAGIDSDRAQQGLIEASNGKLYGTTRFGGTAGKGTIYEYDFQNGIASTIYSFDGMGFGPRCMLVQGNDGKLYGTAEDGGANNRGVSFSYDLTNSSYNVEAPFGSGGVGADPVGGMILGNNGTLLGVSVAGGSPGLGVVYELDPTNGTLSPIQELTNSLGGSSWGRLTASPNGMLYLTTRVGGSAALGTIIEIDTIANTVMKKSDVPGDIGRSRAGTLANYCLLPAFNESLATTYAVCAGDDFTLALGSTNTDTYTWSKNGTVDPNLTSDALNFADLTGAIGGTYEVEMLNECGTTTFTFSLNVTVITAAITSTDAICDTSNDGTISIASPTGGTAPYEFSIDGGTTFGSASSFIGLTPGTYDVQVKENNGCIQSENVEIGLSMVSTASVTDASCNGENSGTIALSASGGVAPYEYSLDGTNFQTSSSFNVIAGSYTLTTKDANGCTVTTPAVVNEPTAITRSITRTDLTCNGDTSGVISITASGGTGTLEYSIDGTNFQTGNSFSGLAGGAYTASIRDGNGCVVTENVTLTEPSALTLSETIENNSCFEEEDGSIQLVASGGTAPYTYMLGTVSSTTGLFDNLAAGSYNATITDANNCELTSNYTITEPNELQASVTETGTSSCGLSDGALDITVTGGTAPYSYALDGGLSQVGSTFSGISAGTYSVTVSDANLCEISITASVNDPVTATVTTTVTDVLCHGGDSGSIEIAVSGGTAPLTYSIDGSTFQSSSSFSNLAEGSYTILIREGNGCEQATNAVVSEPTELVLTFSSSNILCAGEATGSISLAGTGGTGTLSYSIDGTNFSANPIFEQLSAGEYDMFVKDENECSTSSSVTLTEPSALDATSTIVDASCMGSADGSITISTTGGVAPYSYALDNGSPQSGNVFGSLDPGSYTIAVSDDNGCAFSLVDLVVASTVVINTTASVTNVLCFGELTGAIAAASDGGLAPYSYSLGGTNFQPEADFNGLAAGSYTLTSMDSNGCLGSTTIAVTEPTALTLAVTQLDESFTLEVDGGSAPYEYSLDGTTFQSSGSFTDLDPGEYTFTARDANGCTVTSEAFSIVLGLQEVTTRVSLYPNPVQEYFTIDIKQAATVEIYDMGGKLVSQKRVASKVNVEDLIPGLYVLLVKDREGHSIAKGKMVKE